MSSESVKLYRVEAVNFTPGNTRKLLYLQKQIKKLLQPQKAQLKAVKRETSGSRRVEGNAETMQQNSARLMNPIGFPYDT